MQTTLTRQTSARLHAASRITGSFFAPRRPAWRRPTLATRRQGSLVQPIPMPHSKLPTALPQPMPPRDLPAPPRLSWWLTPAQLTSAGHARRPYPAYHAPPPVAGYAPAGAYAPGPGAVEDLRTVFVTGFPNEVKERELNNLLRFLPGYEVRAAHHLEARSLCWTLLMPRLLMQASQLNWRGGQVRAPGGAAACGAAPASTHATAALLSCHTLQAQGFALFLHGQAARDAVTALHGLQ